MAKPAKKAAVRDCSKTSTADDVSSAVIAAAPADVTTADPAAPVTTGARGESPRVNADDGVVPPGELIYSKESGHESVSMRSSRSPKSHGATEFEPAHEARRGSQTHGPYRSRFSHEDEHDGSSPAPAMAHSPLSERGDGATSNTNTSVGTTQEAIDSNVLRIPLNASHGSYPKGL